ncbi:MAG: FtsX-like permease family protein [Acidimicrobiia bacterium]|nr:FtsX-like permease family protein [Acidimicrobiia bacterium]
MLRTTLRSLWEHKRRLISTVVAVVLGVAFMAGTLVLGDTLDNSFDNLFADIGEGIDAEVRGTELFDTGFGAIRQPLDESLVEDVADVDGVTSAAGYIQTSAGRILDSEGEPIGPAQGPPTLLQSYIADPELSGTEMVEGHGPEADDEMVLSRGAAEDGDFAIGDQIEVLVAEGRRTFTLVGVYTIGGRDTAGGTILADFVPEVAQELAGQPGQFNTVLARTDQDISQEELVSRIAPVLPEGAEVVTGEQSSQDQADAISGGLSFFTTFLTIFAVIALAVGGFIIYNTFAILVAQRGRELALLRAIGASRKQVLLSVLVEAAIVGLVAAVIGLVAGISLAIGLQALLSAFGLDLPTSDTTVGPNTIIISLVAGLLITFISAIVPALRATRVPPIAALRDVAIDTSGTSKVRAGAGVVLVVLAAVLVLPAFGADPPTSSLQSVGLGALVFLVALIVLGPILARPLSKGIGWALPKIKGMTGTLARENASRNPKRTAATASALMIGVALVGFITIFASSARASVDAEISRGFKGDFVVQSEAFDFGIPAEYADAVRGADGVETVASLRQGLARLALPDGSETNTFLSSTDPETYTQLIDVRMSEGELSALEPGTIVVDRQAARDEDLAIGDTVSVLFSTGNRLDLQVSAISDEPTLLGVYTINVEDWNANTVNPTDTMVFVGAEEGANLQSLHDELDVLAEPYPTVQVQDRDEFLGSIAAVLNQALNIVYGMLALSILIALIGIGNTLSLSIHERTRELGLLRAVGMTRRQVRSTVRWEAVLISLIGTALGLVIGVTLSYVMIQALKSQGFSVFQVPYGSIVVIVVVFAILGVLASLRPSRRAGKLDILQAIAAE